MSGWFFISRPNATLAYAFGGGRCWFLRIFPIHHALVFHTSGVGGVESRCKINQSRGSFAGFYYGAVFLGFAPVSLWNDGLWTDDSRGLGPAHDGFRSSAVFYRLCFWC